MVNTMVRVKIAMDQQQNNLLAWRLKDYLSRSGFDFDVTECLLSSPGINKELEYPNYQWLILALSSDLKLAKSVKETVDYARDLVTHRRLQGVLAITDSPSPDEIAKLWPTIRIYDIQNEDAMNEAFAQIFRTLKYTKSTVPVSESGDQITNLPQLKPTRPIRSRSMRTSLILVAAVVFMAAIFGFYTLISHLSPSPTHISTFTPTPGHLLTGTASSPSPTSDPTATSDAQALYNNIIKKTNPTTSYPLNPSDSQSKKDWQQTSGTCDLKSDGYHITASTQGQYTPCILQNGTYNDFAFQVQMQISTGGDAGGLIFRSDQKISNFYRFSVDTQGNYILLLCTQCTDKTNGNAQQTLKKNQFPNAANQYTLTVIAKNKTIYLFIGEKLVYQGTDSLSSAGEIGLYAASINQATTVIFTKAKVWKL